MLLFTIICSTLMYLFIDFMPFVELVGFLAVFTEALLGVPQMLCNYHNKSTEGMRWENCVWLFCTMTWMCSIKSKSAMSSSTVMYSTDFIKTFSVFKLSYPSRSKSKGKTVPVQALKDAGGWGCQDFQTIGTWRWQGCHPYSPAAFTSREDPWYSLLQSESIAGS